MTQQMQNSTESVRIRELGSERRLAEERIAELEGQLAGDAPARTADSGMLCCPVLCWTFGNMNMSLNCSCMGWRLYQLCIEQCLEC